MRVLADGRARSVTAQGSLCQRETILNAVAANVSVCCIFEYTGTCDQAALKLMLQACQVAHRLIGSSKPESFDRVVVFVGP